MRTVFMGTPDFAVPVLDAMIKAGHEVGYVITQPDKARNRGKQVQFTPVKKLAAANGIPVLQPQKISLTEKDYVNQLSKFLRRAALFACGLIITLMTGIITVQGIIVKSTDSLLMDTARYSLDNFIPIVGGFASDTIDLFLKCMGSIKNVVGVFGIITIVLLMLSPIIKIVAVALVYKIIGLLTEAVAPPKLSSGISDIGSSLITMGAVLFFSSLLFIIFITCIINLGGG